MSAPDRWRISIVMPCRDAGRWLDETLHSVALQTRPPEELILVDDGSSDDSVAIAHRHAEGFAALPAPRTEMRVVAGEGVSASAARRLGHSLASGDALLFLDADDPLAPDALEALADVLRPGALAACPWLRYELDGPTWVVRPASCAPRSVGRDALSAWLRGWYHPPAALLWSAEALERAGGWDPAYSPNDDGDLAMRALAAGVPLVHARRGTAYYRRMPPDASSLSGARDTARGVASRHRVLDGLERRLEDAGTLARHRADLAVARATIDGAAPSALDRLAGAPGRLSRRARAALRRTAAPAPSALPPAATPAGPGTESDAAAFDEAGAAARPARRAPSIAASAPLVSVIIPTWRRADACLRAVASVRAQTWTRLEILVVDDASNDDTPERLAGVDDPRLRTIARTRNGGVARARNDGLAAARGDHVAFLDSDDLWHPDKLDAQLDAFGRADRRVGLVWTGSETLEPGGGRRVDRAAHAGELFGTLLERNVLHGAPSSALLTRRAVALAGGFDPDYPAIEDWDYWVRVARFHAIGAVDAPLVTYADDVAEDRRSRRAAANHAGRARFEARFRTEMRRHGATRGFLVESARRLLADPDGSAAEARRLLARACREPGRPLRGADLQWVPYALAPAALRRVIRSLDTRSRAPGVTSPTRG